MVDQEANQTEEHERQTHDLCGAERASTVAPYAIQTETIGAEAFDPEAAKGVDQGVDEEHITSA